MKGAATKKDENIEHAIDLRLKKQKHSDFYFKLNNLKDRIEVYKEIFQTRVPRYLRKNHRYFDERVDTQEDKEGEQPEVNEEESLTQEDPPT